MKMNMSKHNLIHKHVDHGNTIDSENRINNYLNDHFIRVGKTSLKRLNRA